MHTNGEERGWSGLVDLERGLRRFLSRYCRDQNVIDDVVQETFVRAAHYRTSLTAAERLGPWARRIALNVLADSLRRQQRYVLSREDDPVWEVLEAPPSGDELPPWRVGRWTLPHEEAVAHLVAALAELRADDRQLLGSYYGGRGSCREAAGECGVPLHLVKIRLFRARRRLRRAIERRLAARNRRGIAVGAVA
ncbi:MAG: RNA polymerase sigma factor [Planctomycetota bacterium]